MVADTKENSYYTLFVSNTNLIEAWQNALSERYSGGYRLGIRKNYPQVLDSNIQPQKISSHVF